MSSNSLVEEPKSYSTEELKAACRWKCCNDLKFLCSDILGMKDWDICHDELNFWLEQSTNSKKLILMPRGHLKSSILTIGLSVQHILKDPDTTILLGSAVWDNARTFLSEIKEYLSNRTILPEVFGKFESGQWTQDYIHIRQRIKANKTPTISTAGQDKAMVSQHYKIIVADDIVNRQTVTTAEQMEKSKKYYSDLLDLLEPDGTLYVIGTRWHHADLYGWLIENQKEFFDIYIQGATRDNTIEGPVIFPKKFSNRKLYELWKGKDLKDGLGSYEFFCQYFNLPTTPESQHFKPPIQYWNELPNGSTHVITFDPATSEKKSSCDGVVFDTCFTPNNQVFAVDYKVFAGFNKKPELMMDKIFEYVQTYRAQKVGVEINGGQEVYVPLLESEMKKRRIHFEIVPIFQKTDKTSRILQLQPKFENGNLLLRQGMKSLEDQMLQFPVASKVDILDAFAMSYQVTDLVNMSRTKVYIPSRFQ